MEQKLIKEHLILAFIHHLGIQNIQNKSFVQDVKQSLFRLEKHLAAPSIQSSGMIQVSSNSLPSSDVIVFDGEKGIELTDMEQFKGNVINNDLNIAIIEILEHLSYMRKLTGDLASSRHPQNMSKYLQACNIMNLILPTTEWFDFMNDKDNTEDKWMGLPRFIGFLIICLSMERYVKVKNSMIIPILLEKIICGFRFSFQSPNSDLSVLDHPEWAISYIFDIFKKYNKVFKQMKQLIKSDKSVLFDAVVASGSTSLSSFTNIIMLEQLQDEFNTLCTEFLDYNIQAKWSKLLANELRLFVYSRLPLLMYDYSTTPEQIHILNTCELTDLLKKKDIAVTLHAVQSEFDDVIKTSIVYTMIRCLTEVALYLRSSYSMAASFELFADFDSNTNIPICTLQMVDGVNKIVFDFEHEHVYGCLDALVLLEHTFSMRMIKDIVNDVIILDNINNRNTNVTSVFLQDQTHGIVVVNIILSVLSKFDERTQCLCSEKSKEKYATKVIIPFVSFYINDMKNKWNLEDYILESCSLGCFLLQSAAILYEYLLKYPQAQYMQSTISTLDRILNRMISILKEYVDEIILIPFHNIAKSHLEVISYLCYKLVEIAAQCSTVTFKKILKGTVESIESQLLQVFIPNTRHDIILTSMENIEMARQNCATICREMAVLFEPAHIADEMPILDDIRFILFMDQFELETNAEYLHGILDAEARYECTCIFKSGTITSFNSDYQPNAIYNEDETRARGNNDFIAGLLEQHEDEFINMETTANANIGNDKLLIESVSEKLMIKKLNLIQMYTIILHALNAQVTPDEFNEYII